MIQILKSIIVVALVSSTIAYIGSKTTSETFATFFIVSTTLQFLFFYFYNSIITYITRMKLEKENLEAIKLINTNNVLINCEACKKLNTVRVDLTTSNEFECAHCKAENILNIEYKTIVKTKIPKNELPNK